jgi:Arc/MetJ family transcription regulator
MTDASGWVGVYSMRMARVNITVPDELLDRARAADLNISRVTAAAVAEELDRLTKIYELDRYLAELDVVLGPVPQSERDEAKALVARMRATPSVRAPSNLERSA